MNIKTIISIEIKKGIESITTYYKNKKKIHITQEDVYFLQLVLECIADLAYLSGYNAGKEAESSAEEVTSEEKLKSKENWIEYDT